jgi:hypothetical protein
MAVSLIGGVNGVPGENHRPAVQTFLTTTYAINAYHH